MLMIIACIIMSFIVGAILMMCAIGMVAIQKDKKPRNKVRFLVRKHIGWFDLAIVGKDGSRTGVCSDRLFCRFGLSPDDFDYMEVGEEKDIFLNLED